jgi:hypothetical protein
VTEQNTLFSWLQQGVDCDFEHHSEFQKKNHMEIHVTDNSSVKDRTLLMTAIKQSRTLQIHGVNIQ